MQRQILFITIFFLLFPFILRAEEIPLSLDEAIVIALRDNRNILLKAEDIKKAKTKIAQSQASLFPALNFTGNWTDTRGYFTKDLAQTATQITLKQYLYKGGKTINTIEQNKYKLEVSQAFLDKTRLELVLNVKKTFYTLLLAEEFANLNREILNNTNEHLNSLCQRYKSGEVSESDILGVESSLSNITRTYESALSQIETVQALLSNLLYLDKDTKIKAIDQLNYQASEVIFDEAFLKAMKDRPEIRQYEAQIKVDKKTIGITKADNRPNIYASWDYYSRSNISTTTTKNWNDYNIISLAFSWPIFDAWLTKSRIEEAIIDLRETQLTKEKVTKDISLEFKNAYISLKNVIGKMESVESNIKVYSDNVKSAEQKYEQGIISLLDLSDANLKYVVSMFNKQQAVYDYLIAKADFDKATGGL